MRNIKERLTRDIKPFGIDRSHFLRSEWENREPPCQVSKIYLLWRTSYAIFCLFASIQSTKLVQREYWFVYLTHWSIIVQVVYGALFGGDLLVYWMFQKYVRPLKDQGHNAEKKNNGVEAAVWILFSVAGITPYFVTAGYWLFVYKPDSKHPAADAIYVHGINAAVAFIDTMVVSIPVHLTHVVYLVAFSAAYILFSGIYELSGATYPEGKHCIYSLLNWQDEPRMTAVCVAISNVIVIVMYTLFWLLYRLRLFMALKCTSIADSASEGFQKPPGDGATVTEMDLRASATMSSDSVLHL